MSVGLPNFFVLHCAEMMKKGNTSVWNCSFSDVDEVVMFL